MLITETITIDGQQFSRNYSDADYYIEQTDTGINYEEAVDPIDNPLGHSYAETNIPLDPDGDVYAEAGRILLGEVE